MKKGRIFGVILSMFFCCVVGANKVLANDFLDSNNVESLTPKGTDSIFYMKKIIDGNMIELNQDKIVLLPKNIKITNQNKIKVFYKDKNNKDILIGRAKLIDNRLKVVFSEKIKSLVNITPFIYLNTSNENNDSFKKIKDESIVDDSNQNKNNQPITDNKKILPIKSGFRPGQDVSVISATLNYDDQDPSIVNWLITVNNKGLKLDNVNIAGSLFNNQKLITGSTKVNYRDKDDNIIKTETNDLNIKQQADKQYFALNFGNLVGKQQGGKGITTSISIHFKTKMNYNQQNKDYLQQVDLFTGSTLIQSVKATANWDRAFKGKVDTQPKDSDKNVKPDIVADTKKPVTTAPKNTYTNSNNVIKNVKRDELPKAGAENTSVFQALGIILIFMSIYLYKRQNV